MSIYFLPKLELLKFG